jgi:hypothetical protein
MSRSFLNLKKSLSFIDVVVISGLSIAQINAAFASCDDNLKIPLNDSKKKVLVDFLKNNENIATEKDVSFSIAEKIPFDICKDNLSLILKNNNQEFIVENDGRKKSSINFIAINNPNNRGYEFYLEVDKKKYQLSKQGELVLHVKSPKCGQNSDVIDGSGHKIARDLCSHNDHYSHMSHYSSAK